MLPLIVPILWRPVAAAPDPVWELRVTAAQVDGTCLYDKAWIPVGQRYLYWDLIQINDPDKYTGKIGEDWRLIRHHKSSFLTRKNSGSVSKKTEGDVFFNLEVLDETSLDFFRGMNKTLKLSNDYAYIDVMRSQLKKPNLLPATAVRYVSERDLYNLNRLNEFNPFSDTSDGRIVLIPVERSACDLKITYLMNRAKARYVTGPFGKKSLISNETVPLSKDEKTFAEKWLEAN